jgi:hypothetical protein
MARSELTWLGQANFLLESEGTGSRRVRKLARRLGLVDESAFRAEMVRRTFPPGFNSHMTFVYIKNLAFARKLPAKWQCFLPSAGPFVDARRKQKLDREWGERAAT